jgi:hypothetical protein
VQAKSKQAMRFIDLSRRGDDSRVCAASGP